MKDSGSLENRDKVRIRSEEQTYASAELYLSAIAHEMKSPLSEIDALAQFILEDDPNLSPQSAEDLRQIRTVCRLNKEAISHFIDMVHIGKAKLNLTVLPMQRMIRERFDHLVKTGKRDHISLEIDELPDLIADESQILLVITNILTNCLKYTRDITKAHIQVTSYMEDGFVCYSFEDNGIGFDARYASDVFQVFQRMHTSDEYEGSGLGLTVVHRIVERFGGHVEIFGRQNVGCTVVISFPSDISVPASESSSAAEADFSIRIGVLHAETGLYASGCKQNRLAYELAAREINESGGILGRQVELIFRDFACDPDLAEKQAWELAEIEKVRLILGGYLSNVRERVRPVARQKKILYFYNSQYEGGVADHNTFCLSDVPDQNILPILDYLAEKVGKRVYLIITDYNYGILTAEYVKNYVHEIGGEVVGVEYLLPYKQNYSVTIENICDAAPDYLFTVFMGAYQNDFFRQWSKKGIAGMPVISTTGISIFYLHNLFPPPIMENVYFMNSYLEVMNTAAARQFTRKITAMMPEDQREYIDFDCETAYISLHLYKRAVELAGSFETEAVIKALESGEIYFDGPGGRVRVRGEDHGTIRDLTLFRVGWNHRIQELRKYRNLHSDYIEKSIEQATGVSGGLAMLGRHAPNIQYSPMFHKV